MSPIVFPTRLKADKEGFEFIASLYKEGTVETSSEIQMDLSEIKFVDANLSAAIGAIFDYLCHEKNKVVVYTWPKHKGVRKILSRNHFLQAFKEETDIEDREKFIEFERFAPNEADKFKQYIDGGLIHKKDFPMHTKLVGEKIVESLFEIFVNAITHGNSKMIYSCGEYNEKDSHPTLDMTIVDLGNTIPYNVNEYLRQKSVEEKEPCGCLEWAFESGNTTKPDTGGLGLSILKEFIQLNKGVIQMVSGKGMLEIISDSYTCNELLCEFPGTIVNMKFNFKDDNIYYMKGEAQENLKDLL